MTDPSKSPDRHTFQKERYLERCKEESKEPSPDYLDMFQDVLEKEKTKWSDPKSRKDNMEYDLVTTDWILEKARASDSYAQNIYAALCNNGFIKLDVIPILTEKEWQCSWRYAGGIVADMLQKGDYIDWYCSGIRNDGYQDDLDTISPNQYVSEGLITDEIRKDFKRLGWVPAKGGDWENFEQTDNT